MKQSDSNEKKPKGDFMEKGINFIIGLVVLGLMCGIYVKQNDLMPKRNKTDDDFDIKIVDNKVDFNDNGVNDYTDIMLGARKDAENEPKYIDKYFSGGYPPENVGVCSDVVWRAFKNAGYSLKDMVDADIKRRPEAYPLIEKPDPNIDFRRVRNLHIFFEKYAVTLTKNIEKTDKWQAGDIVILGDDKHIGIISDKRNDKGVPYVIHNDGQPDREEDILKESKVIAHYRFDASKINKKYLKVWKD